MIEVLHRTQDLYGYIPKEVISIVSAGLSIPVSAIYGVVTFYSRFSLVPKGKYAVSVCMGTACYVKGSQEVMNEFSSLLGIGIGETTEDLLFSLIETRCVGDCAHAPVVMINDTVYPNITKEKVEALIAEVKEA